MRALITAMLAGLYGQISLLAVFAEAALGDVLTKSSWRGGRKSKEFLIVGTATVCIFSFTEIYTF